MLINNYLLVTEESGSGEASSQEAQGSTGKHRDDSSASKDTLEARERPLLFETKISSKEMDDNET